MGFRRSSRGRESPVAGRRNLTFRAGTSRMGTTKGMLVKKKEKSGSGTIVPMLLLRPANAQTFFDLVIMEIVAKPRAI